MSYVFIYDKTQGWLTASWWFGAALRSLRPGKDIILNIRSWDEMVEQLNALPKGSVERVEYWGHGLSSAVHCAGVPLPEDVLELVADRMTGPTALWWWRTCKTFWGEPGHDFAKKCAEALGCRVAGFTHWIWLWQSGLTATGPEETAPWPTTGGKRSWPWRENTVFCTSSGPF